VVVPTRDRPEALATCLRALDRQEGVQPEVVIVDDASADPVAVDRVVTGWPGTRLLVGEGRGPAAARNLGARAARADVICFTDDDCRPRPDWASALLGRLAATPGAAAVGGPTVVGVAGDAVATAAQIVTNHLVDASFDPATGHLGFVPTSNLAVRTEVHRAIPFDEEYPLAAGEDRDWCDRLAGRGEVLVYEPAALVDHHPDLDLRRFWRQQVRYGRGSTHFRTGEGRGRQSLAFYTGLLRRGLADGPRVGALVALSQVATAIGTAQEHLHR
jgi:cellulose synthase/poly-beta-1,6-N-acetylglucosamine synthase-like glycosyltransferase